MPKTKRKQHDNAMAAGPAQQGQQLKGRLWLEREGQTYLSWGRVVLLERIKEKGSVSAAAKSMGMSFSHAWQLVESMNSLAPEPLVQKQAGGKGGGGAWLTPAGDQAVGEFWDLVQGFQQWIDTQKQ
ncbi:MAG: LysR family transcriptional regulator [Desulfarculaceae bacterium]|nr:LysR family transcriptional regulator [Desulfarculaceae bacterium]MCF8072378.1 LysR family transcriptional regulator [Desulfarculaceae bacterium]MCF8100299.1 LysR family transcriptional regulator [Desulfarculaceae bacterium]MCF8116128.1 LysR family transcriptional regulator [Desulfarculaceae bacterium]